MAIRILNNNYGGRVSISSRGLGGRFQYIADPPPGPLLLDSYPNAAAAYSLRKLRTAYTGSAIRVRRSSDNTETDIGFVNNQLDTTTLLTFCGAGNGLVTVWYDQSGIGVNAIQSTTVAQPRIVLNGTLYLENSKPSIKFGGGSENLRRTGTMPLIERSFAFVGKQDSSQLDAGVFGFAPSGGGNDFNSPDTFVFSTANSGESRAYVIEGSTSGGYKLQKNGSGSPVLQYGLYLETKTTSTGNLYENNNLIATDSSFTQFDASNTQSLVLGGRQFNSAFFGFIFIGNFQEFIYWSVSNTANRTAIETNINSYYSIY